MQSVRIKPLWQTGTDRCMDNVMFMIVVNLGVEILVGLVMGKMDNVDNVVIR